MGLPKKEVSAGLISDMKPNRGRESKETLLPFPPEVFVAMDSDTDAEQMDLETSLTPLSNGNISYYRNVVNGESKRMARYVLQEVVELRVIAEIKPLASEK